MTDLIARLRKLEPASDRYYMYDLSQDAAVALEAAQADNERLRAKCNQRRDDLKQARDILHERFSTIERLREAVDDFISQIRDCSNDHDLCEQLTSLSKAVQENLVDLAIVPFTDQTDECDHDWRNYHDNSERCAKCYEIRTVDQTDAGEGDAIKVIDTYTELTEALDKARFLATRLWMQPYWEPAQDDGFHKDQTDAGEDKQ